MILNVTAQKVLTDATKSRYIEDWNNVHVIFYVKQNEKAADGGRVDALRIEANGKYGDQNKLPELRSDDALNISKVKNAIAAGYTIDDIRRKWNIKPEIEKLLK